MREHLSEEAMIDAAGGDLSAEARRHLEVCAGCRERVAWTVDALAVAEDADVPEPPPLYWESFRRQVGRRVADEPRRRWLPALLPALAAAAAILVAVWLQARRPVEAPVPSPVALLPAWSPLPPADEDPGLAVLQAFGRADGSLETALPSDGVESALAGLTDDESAALAEALRHELQVQEAS